jgi:hypothetical protein
MLTFRSCLLFVLAACGPKPPQTETTDGDTSNDPLGGSTSTTTSTTAADPTTGAASSTGANTSGGGFMLPPDEGVMFILRHDGGSGCGCGFAASPGVRCKECDPWVQDCPEDEKCTPCSGDGDDEWDAQKCIPLPADPDHAGEPCTVDGKIATGHDSCDLATVCWFIDPDTLTGTCVPRCTGSPDQPVCAEGTSCMISHDGVILLCLPTCDPLGDDCGPGRLCIPNIPSSDTDFVCVPDKSGDEGQPFDSCEFFDTCDPGLLCAEATLATECDPMASGCCLPFCDLTMPAPCPGAMQECLPFFPEDPPPGHDDLGVCGIPG